MRYIAPALGLLWCACGSEAPPPEGKGPRIVSFTVTPAELAAGETATLTWEATTGVNIEPRIGLRPASGSEAVRPLVTTTYRLTIPGAPLDLFAEATVTVAGDPRVESFAAEPRTVRAGEASTLAWTTKNADSVIIEPEVGAVANAAGNVQVTPAQTTTYRLTAVRGGKVSQPSETTVVVASGTQPVIRSFSAQPQNIAAGATTTLAWDVSDADRVSIDNGVGAQATTGSINVAPARTTTFTLLAVGPGGQASASVTVQVASNLDPSILHFNANPATIAPGGRAELDWDTDNAEGVRIEPGIGEQPAKGSIFVSPTQTTTYELIAFSSGRQVSQMTTVVVTAPEQPVIDSFVAQPQAVLEGSSTTLSWATTNAMAVEIDNGVGAGLATSGSLQVQPSVTTTYTLTARGTGGDATQQLTVTVMPAPPSVVTFSAQPASINAGGVATLSWSTTGADRVVIDQGVGMMPANGTAMVMPSQTTSYNLTAEGPGGQATAQVTVTVTAVGAPTIVSFTATPPQILPGAQTNLAWQVQNATEVRIDNGVGVVPASGSVAVSPAQATTYTLTAVGPGGQTTAQVAITVVSPTGDTCADAFEITQSGTFTGNTQTVSNNYSATTGCTGYTSNGPDVVYRLNLAAGDRLFASLSPTNGTWDTALYLLSGCADVASSCVAGQDNGNPEEIDFVAAASGTYYLVVDGFSSTGGTYSLTVNLNPAPLANDTCGGAIDITAGGTFSGNTSVARNDYSPSATATGGCTGYSAQSYDVAYQVTLAAGERLQASVNAAWDASVYLVTDCALAATTCVAGQDNGNPEQLDYTAVNAGTYFLIVDGYGSARGAFTLTSNISPPVQGGDTCANPVMIPAAGGSFQSSTAMATNDYSPPLACVGQAQPGRDQVYAMSLVAGEVIEAAASFAPTLDGALYLTQSCTNITCLAGADAAAAGATESVRMVARQTGVHYLLVDSPTANAGDTHDLAVARWTGETCALAPPLSLEAAGEWFTTQGRTNDYSPSSSSCLGVAAAGPDRAYSVALTAGDQLQVTVAPNGTWDTSVYLVSNCADINGSCLAGADENSSGDEIIAPVVQTTGTYYLIVDGYLSASGTGNLTAVRRRGDTCADAYYVPDVGGTFRGTTAGYGAELGITASTGSCTGFSQTGNDAVYAVRLGPNQTVEASVSATWDAALYLVSSCEASATTCVAGQDNGNPETLTFANPTGAAATYYLVVDSWRPTAGTTVREGSYTLTVSFR